MKQYKVIRLRDSDKFSEMVEDHLANGWQTQGGVSIAYTQNGAVLLFAQAVVKGES